MLIHNKDDIEFVTGFPCFLGHPVLYIYRYTSLEPSVALRVETDVPRQIKSPLTQLKISKSFFLGSTNFPNQKNHDVRSDIQTAKQSIRDYYFIYSIIHKRWDFRDDCTEFISFSLYLGFSTPVNCLFFVAMSINRSLEDNIKGRRRNLTL